jgi:hypothetical protein
MTLKFVLEPSNAEDILYTQADTPTLDLRFASSKSLVDHISGQNLIDFTRASSGTYVDSQGVIRSAVTNLLLQSEDFETTWAGTRLRAFGSGSAANAIAAPNGTLTADKIVEDTATGGHYISQSVAVSSGVTYSASCHMKAAERNLAYLALATTPNAIAYFDLSNGTIADSSDSDVLSATITPVGDGWYRCSVTTISTSASTSIRIGLTPSINAGTFPSYTGDGTSGIYIWGAQLEVGSTATEYLPTSATINGAPRITHDPTTGKCLGLLVEESRTNLLLQSEDFSTTWNKGTNTTLTTNYGMAPNGTMTADRLQMPNDIQTFVSQSVTTVAGQSYVFSIYARATSGSSPVVFGLGTETRSFTLSETWQRYSVSFTATGGTTGAQVDNGSNVIDVLVWGAQLELGAFPSSYIPTTTLAATRSADLATITGSNFSSWYRQDEGTVFSQSSVIAPDVQTQTVWSLTGGTYITSLRQPQGTGDKFRAQIGGTFTPSPGTGAALSSGTTKACVAYSGTAGRLQVGSSSNDVTASGVLDSTQFNVGSLGGTSTILNGTISRLAYWPHRLPNPTLQSITSDTTPTTYGNLVFDSGNAPAAIAGVAPTLDYRFAREKREIETVSLLDKLTYTGGNGTFVGSDGYIQRATTNVPRFDHDPLSRVSKGLLVEESRENLLLRSEEFDSASWTPDHPNGSAIANVTANAGTAPNGTETADLVSGVFTEADRRHQTVSLSPGVSYCFSVYVKPTTSSLIRIGILSVPSTWIGSVDILWSSGVPSTNATVGSPTGISYTDVGNGWYRCSIVVAIASAGSYQAHFHPDRNNAQKAALVWGAQLEVGEFPTSYIPTTASTVTRTADSAVIDGTGVLTGTYTIVEKPAGCAVESGGNIELQAGYTAERVMVFPASLSAQQITDIRSAM